MPINLIIRNPLDRDAREFIQRANVTDAAGRAQLNEFVRGVKQLGLWNSMVCWPLRSTQNAGTGTTAYSLGGLGTYNGTMVNGPTWGTSGITFDPASSTVINVSGLPDPTFLASLFCSNHSSVSTTQTLFSVGSSFGIFPVEGVNTGKLFRNRNAAGAIDDFRPNQAFSAGAFTAIVNSISGANKFQQRDGVVTTTFTKAYTDSLHAFSQQIACIGASSSAGGAATDGTISFGGLFYTGGIEQSQAAAIYNLYKSTLGTGLSLP